MGQLDDAGSDTLTRAFTTAVRWVAHRRSVSRELAEEAVQEALLQWIERSAGSSPRDFDAWLRRVAERRLIDAERHRRTQIPATEGASVEDVPVLDDLLEVRSALRRLEPEARALVVHRLSGASWRELSAGSGLPEDAIRKRFERSLAQMRAWIDGL